LLKYFNISVSKMKMTHFLPRLSNFLFFFADFFFKDYF